MLVNRRRSERRLCRKLAQDPVRDRLVAARLYDHGHFGWRREGNRRISRHSHRVHHHFVGRPPAPMPAGMADRLRIRRSIRRLDRKAPFELSRPAGLLVRRREVGIRELARVAPDRTGAGRLFNGNLGLSCEHFGQSPTTGQSTCSSHCSSDTCFARRLATAFVRDVGVGALQLPDRGPSDISDVTGSLGEKAEASRAADPRREVESYRDRFRANPKDADAALQYGKALRDRGTAVPGGRGARTGHDRPSRQQGAAGRLWAGAGGQWQFPAGLRRAQPRP